MIESGCVVEHMAVLALWVIDDLARRTARPGKGRTESHAFEVDEVERALFLPSSPGGA